MSYQHAICQLLVGDKLYGTGFLFTDDKRYLLTAHHVFKALQRANPDLQQVEARFVLAGASARLAAAERKEPLGDASADWVALELGAPMEIAPIKYGEPKEAARVDAWGYPNALHVGLAIPDRAIVSGSLKDVLDKSTQCVLTAEHRTGDCRGMSGSPVVSDTGAWVGIVVSCHANERHEPMFGQIKVCRSETVTAACQPRLPLSGGRYGVRPLVSSVFPTDDPFPGLVPLTERHARMLHGRFKLLRILLEYVHWPNQLVLLVTGRVGVGKSSLLRAGLVPYLKDEGTPVRCLVRDPALGLGAQAAAMTAIAGAVVVIDQAEECLSGLLGEAAALAHTLGRWSMLTDSERPRAVVLGCRSDHADDLAAVIKPHCGLRSEQIPPLDRDSIIEVLRLRGDAEAPRALGVDVRYSELEAGQFADELLRDEDTTVAPLLQLRMRAMYDRDSGTTKVFDAKTYAAVAMDLPSLERHLEAQLAAFNPALRAFVDSGLVLDILEFHTTPQSTVQPRDWGTLVARYTTSVANAPNSPPCTEAQLAQIVHEMQSLRLLVDRPVSRSDRGTTIGHDEFARLAKAAFQRSPLAGQRCRRLLEFQLENTTTVDTIVLDELDLQIVQTGCEGMRVVTGAEASCIQRSLDAQKKRLEEAAAKSAAEADKQRNLQEAQLQAAQAKANTAESELRRVRLRNRLTGGMLAMVAMAGVVAFVLNRARQQTTRANISAQRGALNLADRNFNEAEISFAQSIALNDSTEVRRSLVQARGGTLRLTQRNPGGASIVSSDGQCYATARGANGLDIGSVEQEGSPTRWRISLPELAPNESESPIENMVFGPPAIQGRSACENRMFAYATSGDHVVRVVRLEAGAEVTQIGKVPRRWCKRISTIAFSPDAGNLAIGSDENSIGVYELVPALHERWFNPAAHQVAVHGVAFRNDGAVLASGGGDYEVHLWWVSDGQLIGKGIGHQDSVFSVAFSADGKRLASGGYDRAIRIWDASPCKGDQCRAAATPAEMPTVQILQGHIGVVENLQFSRNDKMLASASKDETLRIWDVERARAVATLTPRVGPLRSVSLTSFDEPVACGGDGGWVRWRAGAYLGIEKAWITGAPIGAVAMDRSGLLVVGDSDGNVYQSQLGARFAPQRIGTVSGGINNVVFSPDGRWLVAAGGASLGAHAPIWERIDGGWRPTAVNITMDGAVWGAAFDASSRWLAVGDTHTQAHGAEIQVWELIGETWQLRARTSVAHDVYSLVAIAVPSDPRHGLLTSGNSNGELHAYEFPLEQGATSLREVRAVQNVQKGEQNVWNVAAIPNQGWIISANSDGIVRIWDPLHGDQEHGLAIAQALPNEARINPTLNAVAYNPFTNRVASAGDGQQVVEYELTPQPLRLLSPVQRFLGQEGTVWMVAYSPDGRYLVYGGLDGFVRIIDLREANRVMTEKPEVLMKESIEATGIEIDGGLEFVAHENRLAKTRSID